MRHDANMTSSNNFARFIGRKCKVFLKNNQCYTGKIEAVDSVSVCMVDKFGLDVVISISDLSLIRDFEADER